MKGFNAYKKCLWAIPLAVLMNLSCLEQAEKGSLDGDLNYFFLNSIFDSQSLSSENYSVLVLSFMSIAFVLVFSILCGMDIYRELYSTGIYVMIRVKSRVKWIYTLIVKLAIKAVLFSILYIGVTWWLKKYYTQLSADESSCYAIGYALFFLFMTTFFIALVINFLSLWKNTTMGCLGGVTVLLLMILYILFYDNIPVLGNVYYLRYLSPLYICNLFYESDFKLIAGCMCYYVMLTLFVSIGFANVVEKLDVRVLNENV